MTHIPSVRHVRPVQPLEFPSYRPEFDLGETQLHGRMCELLYVVLTRLLGASHTVGKDNFVYWDAHDPKMCLAPDGFVKLGVAQTLFPSWQTWDKGAPELCVEIVSPSDAREYLPLATKMKRYHALGTEELIVFDTEAPSGTRLRAFDRVDGDLVERVIELETTPCLTLTRTLGARCDWITAPSPADGLDLSLRLTRDGVLVPTDKEEIVALKTQLAQSGSRT